jgi:hypothetical protein
MAQIQPTQGDSIHGRGLHGMTISEKGMKVDTIPAPPPPPPSSTSTSSTSSSSSHEAKEASNANVDAQAHDEAPAMGHGAVPRAQDVGIGPRSPAVPSSIGAEELGICGDGGDGEEQIPQQHMLVASGDSSAAMSNVPAGVQEKLREGLVIPIDAVEAPRKGCIHSTGDMFGHAAACAGNPSHGIDDDDDDDDDDDSGELAAALRSYEICRKRASELDAGIEEEPCHEGSGERERLNDPCPPCHHHQSL